MHRHLLMSSCLFWVWFRDNHLAFIDSEKLLNEILLIRYSFLTFAINSIKLHVETRYLFWFFFVRLRIQNDDLLLSFTRIIVLLVLGRLHFGPVVRKIAVRWVYLLDFRFSMFALLDCWFTFPFRGIRCYVIWFGLKVCRIRRHLVEDLIL
jgi:hypothetical protein